MQIQLQEMDQEVPDVLAIAPIFQAPLAIGSGNHPGLLGNHVDNMVCDSYESSVPGASIDALMRGRSL
jgi:hypothetical protein